MLAIDVFRRAACCAADRAGVAACGGGMLRNISTSARHRGLRVHTVVATLSIERLRRLCRFRRTAFGLVIG